jgi:ABC-type branched-subunit amino acid transport system ATPase component
MKSVFQTLQAEGLAILFIEQNVRLALSMAGRGYVLESGRLAIEGDAPTPNQQAGGTTDFSGWIRDQFEPCARRLFVG